jgi:hypothetical protein
MSKKRKQLTNKSPVFDILKPIYSLIIEMRFRKETNDYIWEKERGKAAKRY